MKAKLFWNGCHNFKRLKVESGVKRATESVWKGLMEVDFKEMVLEEVPLQMMLLEVVECGCCDESKSKQFVGLCCGYF